MNVTMYNISIILIKVNRLYEGQHIRRIEQFRLRRFDRADAMVKYHKLDKVR